MKRDFSESAKKELLRLVKQVEDEQWSKETDKLGDLWYGFEAKIGMLDIRKYVDNVSKYHKKVIDKENLAEDDIKEIFEAVNEKDGIYQSRLIAQITDLQSYRQLIRKMAETIAPGNGSSDGALSCSGLKSSVEAYLKDSGVLQQIAGDGLDSKTIEAKGGPSALQKVLDRMGTTLIGLVPDVQVGQRFEMPIGIDTVFYYEVETTVDTDNAAGIGLVVEDQRLKLGKLFTETGGELSIGSEVTFDGEGKVVVRTENSGVEFAVDGSMLSGSGSVTIGNTTYTILIEGSIEKLKLEESVTTKVEGGSVTTKIGIEKATGPNGTGWEPIPEPVAVMVPYPCELPDFDVDWDGVGDVVIAAGECVVTVVVIGGIIYLSAHGVPVWALAV